MILDNDTSAIWWGFLLQHRKSTTQRSNRLLSVHTSFHHQRHDLFCRVCETACMLLITHFSAGVYPWSRFLNLTMYLPLETEYAPWSEAIPRLSSIVNHFTFTSNFAIVKVIIFIINMIKIWSSSMNTMIFYYYFNSPVYLVFCQFKMFFTGLHRNCYSKHIIHSLASNRNLDRRVKYYFKFVITILFFQFSVRNCNPVCLHSNGFLRLQHDC